MAYVAAFAVSQYANAKHRTTRKPFNPIMGETYELVREDLGKLELGFANSRVPLTLFLFPGFRFIAEKVVHTPPKLAGRADGDGWTYWCTSGAKNKLSGLSLEMLPVGYHHIVFDDGERFS
jgi:oxysterol-binding protein-related protein 3/6/7